MCDDDLKQSDAALVAEWKTGDESAGDELYNRHTTKLKTIARLNGLSLQDAEDCVQNTWIGVWKSLHAYDEQGQFQAWLSTIHNRTIFQHIREQVRHKRGGGKKLLSLDADGGQNEDGSHRKIEPASREPQPNKTTRKGTSEWAARLTTHFSPDLHVCDDVEHPLVNPTVIAAHLEREFTGDNEKVICGVVCELSKRQHECFVLQDWLDLKYGLIAQTLNISVHAVKYHLSEARENLRQKISEAQLE